MPRREQDDITRIVQLVTRRQRLTVGLTWFSMSCMGLATIALVLAVVDRLGVSSWVPWTWILSVFISLAVAIGLFGWWRTRLRPLDTARRVDDRLGLKDRLSSALACGHRADPFARALIEDAGAVARSPRTRELVRRRFRVSPPPLWWTSPLLVLLALVVTMFGQWDLFTSTGIKSVDLDQVRETASESIETTVEAIREDEALSDALSDVLDELEAEMGASLEQKDDEESIRREALKRVSDINRRLEDILDGPDGKALNQLKKSLEALNAPDDSPIKDLIDALSKSDFAAAQDALSRMEQQIQSGDLTDAELDRAAQALQALSDQLREMAASQQALSDALRQAGLDPALADDPEALKQAIEQSTELNESQKQQLQELAESNERVKQMLQELAEASDQACKECKGGKEGGNPSPGGCQSMSDQLSRMEQLQEMLNQAKAVQSACKGQCDKLGQGLAKQSACNAAGVGGQGGRGQSVGSEETATSTTLVDDSGKSGDGPVVSSLPVDRDLDVGESTLTLHQARQTAREGFDEALNETPLPRQYHDVLKHYFGDREAVERAVEADSAEETSGSAPKASSSEGAGGGEE